MKKILILLLGMIVMACGDASNTSAEGAENVNSEENVNENSGDNISPQLETNADSTSRLEVDTISSASGAKKQGQ